MTRFLKSFTYAARGIWLTIKAERNFKIQIIALCLTVASGLYLGLSKTEWGLIVLSIGFVLTAELFNTALERLGSQVSDGKRSELIRNAKDISAGAVLLSALTALVIAVIILFIPFVQRIAGFF
jgi:diacylglycerol kinase